METIEFKIEAIIDKYDLQKTDTTTGMNGYPEWTDVAFYCDKRSDLVAAAEEIRDLGCEVSELWMKKRDGQHFWNRYSTSFSLCDLKVTSDQDWTINVDMDDDEETIKEIIRDALFGTPEEKGDEYNPDEEIIETFFSDLRFAEGEVTVFYNPDGYGIDYFVDDESTGYHDGDVTSYQMAFSIELPDEEE